MEKELILQWLNDLKTGKISSEEIVQKLEGFPYQDLGFAKVDLHRSLRQGSPEVIYCPGKTDEEILSIFLVLNTKAKNVMATRADPTTYHKIKEMIPEAIYFERARIIAVWREKEITQGVVGILSAGTADLHVAEEAAVTAEIMGSKVHKFYDVGVAGIHRLFDHREMINNCRVLIVVAGMEGALASVVGGLVDKPIVAVPTSVGYGANFHGISALLTMLNSCAGGIGVVNIDNGFGAGVLAHRINIIGEIK